MINELIVMRLRKHIDDTEEAEIKATIFYVWMGVVLPSYCHVRYSDPLKSRVLSLNNNISRFMTVVRSLLRDLQTPSYQLPHWLHVTKDSIPGIVASLRYWDTQLSHRTVQEMLRRHRQFENSPVDLPNLHLQDIKAEIDDMTDDEVINFGQVQMQMPPPSENEARQEWLTGMRIVMFRMLASGNDKSRRSFQFSNEEAWYGITQCFIPPKVLRARHKSFDELWAGISQLPTQVLKKQV